MQAFDQDLLFERLLALLAVDQHLEAADELAFLFVGPMIAGGAYILPPSCIFICSLRALRLALVFSAALMYFWLTISPMRSLASQACSCCCAAVKSLSATISSSLVSESDRFIWSECSLKS